MKNLNSNLAKAGVCAGLCLLTALPLKAQEVKQNNEYAKIGFVSENFNKKELKDEVGTMIGVQLATGFNFLKYFRGELSTSGVTKKLENETLSIFDLGAYLDLNVFNFYAGIGFKGAYIADKYEGQKTSGLENYGYSGRIGYELPIGRNTFIYGEYNYSKLTPSDNKEVDLGTSEITVGIKF